MYKSCTTERAAQQQRQFENALLCALENSSLAEISVTALCKSTGLSRKTFYRLFETKEDVLVAIVDHTLDDYSAFACKNKQNELTAFFEYWQQQKALLDALCANKKNSLLVDRSVVHIQEKESSALRHFNLPMSKNSVERILFYMSGIMALVMHWHQSGFEKTPAEMSEILTELMTVSPTNSEGFAIGLSIM